MPRKRREREREVRSRSVARCKAVFSSLGAFVLRGQENSAGKIIFLPIPRFHFAVVYSSQREDDSGCSSAIVSTDSQRALSLPFPSSALVPSPPPFPSPCAIESRIYPYSVPYLLRLIIKFSFWRTSSAPLFAGSPSAAFQPLLAARVPIHHVQSRSHSQPRRMQSFSPRLPLSPHHPQPHISSICYVSLFIFEFLFFRFHPRLRSHGSIYENGRYGVSSTVICLRRLIIAALLRP